MEKIKCQKSIRSQKGQDMIDWIVIDGKSF
jgi:hypothetical protein